MSLNQWVDYCAQLEQERPEHMRHGQWAYIILERTHPEIAKEICGSHGLDPFYRDDLMDAFLLYVYQRLTGRGENGCMAR